jgi:hypothetical protein
MPPLWWTKAVEAYAQAGWTERGEAVRDVWPRATWADARCATSGGRADRAWAAGQSWGPGGSRHAPATGRRSQLISHELATQRWRLRAPHGPEVLLRYQVVSEARAQRPKAPPLAEAVQSVASRTHVMASNRPRTVSRRRAYRSSRAGRLARARKRWPRARKRHPLWTSVAGKRRDRSGGTHSSCARPRAGTFRTENRKPYVTPPIRPAALVPPRAVAPGCYGMRRLARAA